MRILILAAALALAPLSAAAQDRAQTLADIKAEIAALQGQFNDLKRELVSTGAATSGAAGGSALQRMDAMEAAIAQVTAKAESLELKINRVVSDGSNRVGDLEFRVCEPRRGLRHRRDRRDEAARRGSLGGPRAHPAPAPAADPAGTFAVNEKADFDRAQEVLGQGDFRTAADLLKTFAETYTGGQLTYEAHYLRGEALSQLGETANAARAYLESFSGDPDGPRAPEALLKLGRALGDLRQTPEACVTLAEVGTRFPGSPSAAEAATTMQGLGCS